MSQKIPKEKLRDLYERSLEQAIEPAQCAVWLPVVCELALELLEEKEARERAMAMLSRLQQFKKGQRG